MRGGGSGPNDSGSAPRPFVWGKRELLGSSTALLGGGAPSPAMTDGSGVRSRARPPAPPPPPRPGGVGAPGRAEEQPGKSLRGPELREQVDAGRPCGAAGGSAAPRSPWDRTKSGNAVARSVFSAEHPGRTV